jgi:hypothetical protein
MPLTMSPKTRPVPYPFMDAKSADELRDVAFGIEASLDHDGNHVVIERAGLIYIRTALLDLADRIDRD